jgi:hypothetical protein
MRWLAIVALVTACKGDPVKCEAACRNYAELVFWDQANAEINAAPPAERENLRKQKAAKFTADLEHGIDFCSNRCISAGNDDQIKCLSNAKTAKDAKDCVAD